MGRDSVAILAVADIEFDLKAPSNDEWHAPWTESAKKSSAVLVGGWRTGRGGRLGVKIKSKIGSHVEMGCRGSLRGVELKLKGDSTNNLIHSCSFIFALQVNFRRLRSFI